MVGTPLQTAKMMVAPTGVHIEDYCAGEETRSRTGTEAHRFQTGLLAHDMEASYLSGCRYGHLHSSASKVKQEPFHGQEYLGQCSRS